MLLTAALSPIRLCISHRHEERCHDGVVETRTLPLFGLHDHGSTQSVDAMRCALLLLVLLAAAAAAREHVNGPTIIDAKEERARIALVRGFPVEEREPVLRNPFGGNVVSAAEPSKPERRPRPVLAHEGSEPASVPVILNNEAPRLQQQQQQQQHHEDDHDSAASRHVQVNGGSHKLVVIDDDEPHSERSSHGGTRLRPLLMVLGTIIIFC